jgi:N6-L-threonylcarbamoyladenine synthase
MAIDEFGIRDFAMAGGVASNQALRGALKAACEQEGVNFYCPSPIYCTDNAAMIAVAGYFEYRDGNLAGLDLNAVPGLRM